MHRTNVYLTSEQETALDARARAQGSTRSAVLRAIIDRAIAEPSPDEGDVVAGFAELADRYHEMTQDLFDADDDLRIDS